MRSLCKSLQITMVLRQKMEAQRHFQAPGNRLALGQPTPVWSLDALSPEPSDDVSVVVCPLWC